MTSSRREAALAALACANGLLAVVLLMRDSARPASVSETFALTTPVAYSDGLPSGDTVTRSYSNLHALFDGPLSEARYVDLTHAIHPRMPLWDAFAQPKVSGATAGFGMAGFVDVGETFSYAKQGFIATASVLSTDQLGTQLDPPAHWNELGATISDIPATVALRPLVVVDVSAKVALDAGYHATTADVLEWEASYGRVPRGSVVLFRSDWSKQWENYYPALPATFPGVALETLKFLHLERSILVHGHEPLDTDMTPSLEGEAWLMHNDFMQIEGIANLHLVPPTGALITLGCMHTRMGLEPARAGTAAARDSRLTRSRPVVDSPQDTRGHRRLPARHRHLPTLVVARQHTGGGQRRTSEAADRSAAPQRGRRAAADRGRQPHPVLRTGLACARMPAARPLSESRILGLLRQRAG